MYPKPPLTISTAIIFPFVSIIGLPSAPTPLPPKILIVGDDIGLGELSHDSGLRKSLGVNALT